MPEYRGRVSSVIEACRRLPLGDRGLCQGRASLGWGPVAVFDTVGRFSANPFWALEGPRDLAYHVIDARSAVIGESFREKGSEGYEESTQEYVLCNGPSGMDALWLFSGLGRPSTWGHKSHVRPVANTSDDGGPANGARRSVL
jgi:hypothetical protein